MTPDFPRTVRVRMSRGGEQGWTVRDVGECRECSATIFWCWTGNKKDDGSEVRAPVNAEPDADGLHLSHFATCPRAGQFRKKKERRS